MDSSSYPRAIRTLGKGVCGQTVEKFHRVDSLKQEIQIREFEAQSLAQAAKEEAEMWHEVDASMERDDEDEETPPATP